MLPEIRQNAPAATIPRPGPSGGPRAPDAPGAAITSAFLTHCLGRESASSARGRLRTGRMAATAPAAGGLDPAAVGVLDSAAADIMGSGACLTGMARPLSTVPMAVAL